MKPLRATALAILLVGGLGSGAVARSGAGHSFHSLHNSYGTDGHWPGSERGGRGNDDAHHEKTHELSQRRANHDNIRDEEFSKRHDDNPWMNPGRNRDDDPWMNP